MALKEARPWGVLRSFDDLVRYRGKSISAVLIITSAVPEGYSGAHFVVPENFSTENPHVRLNVHRAYSATGDVPVFREHARIKGVAGRPFVKCGPLLFVPYDESA